MIKIINPDLRGEELAKAKEAFARQVVGSLKGIQGVRDAVIDDFNSSEFSVCLYLRQVNSAAPSGIMLAGDTPGCYRALRRIKASVRGVVAAAGMTPGGHPDKMEVTVKFVSVPRRCRPARTGMDIPGYHHNQMWLELTVWG